MAKTSIKTSPKKKNMVKFVRKLITIREDQVQIIEKHGLNLSKFVQKKLDAFGKELALYDN